MISDAAPLINFAKLNKLQLLIECFGTIEISDGVLNEAVNKERFYQEAKLISEQITKQKISVKSLSEEYCNKAKLLQNAFKLGVGESEAIALALQENASELLIDDSDGRAAAELNGLNPVGSLRVLLIAFDRSIANEDDVLKIFRKLIENRFWIRSDITLKFLELFEKLKKGKTQ